MGAKPATTQLDEAPKVAILVNTASPSESDTSWSLRQIFGPDVGFVSTTSGANSLQNAVADPLADFDVIYNTGQDVSRAAPAQEPSPGVLPARRRAISRPASP